MADIRGNPKGQVETRQSMQQIAQRLKKQGVTITTPGSISNPPTQAEVQGIKDALDDVIAVLNSMGVL